MNHSVGPLDFTISDHSVTMERYRVFFLITRLGLSERDVVGAGLRFSQNHPVFYRTYPWLPPGRPCTPTRVHGRVPSPIVLRHPTPWILVKCSGHGLSHLLKRYPHRVRSLSSTGLLPPWIEDPTRYRAPHKI